MDPVLAYRIHKTPEGIKGGFEHLPLEEIGSGEVLLEACYSSLNYKDALAATGQGAILRSFPLIGGIDVAGVVVESADARFQVGDEVLVTGCGLGEAHDGGFARYVRVPSDWVVKKPLSLSLWETMAYGTAGFSAALAFYKLLQNEQSPDQGPIVVTGASGGVGSVAVGLLAKLGFAVIALTEKPDYKKMLLDLGAEQVLSFAELDLPRGKRLSKERFGGAIDLVGGEVLERLLPAIGFFGNVVSVGMAGGSDFKASVFPHILRGVSLLGISSANCPMPRRQELWQHLATDWRLPQIGQFTKTHPLSRIEEAFSDMMARKSKGRIVIDCKG